jgi:hypothetical protein
MEARWRPTEFSAATGRLARDRGELGRRGPGQQPRPRGPLGRRL